MPNDNSPTPPDPDPAVVETTDDVTPESPAYDPAASLAQAALDLLAVMPSLL